MRNQILDLHFSTESFKAGDTMNVPEDLQGGLFHGAVVKVGVDGPLEPAIVVCKDGSMYVKGLGQPESMSNEDFEQMLVDAGLSPNRPV